jgi:lipoprotein-releasing system permease protein
LEPDVYSISHVPFRASLIDGLLVSTAAVLISFLATLYPSKSAARLDPVEALRYE